MIPTPRNLTPHPLTLRTAAGDAVIPPSGTVARCAPPAASEDVSTGLAVPVFRAGPLGDPVGLPDPQPGVFLIVSLAVLTHPKLAGRRDVLAPGTGPADGAIRDAEGRVVAVTRLVGRVD